MKKLILYVLIPVLLTSCTGKVSTTHEINSQSPVRVRVIRAETRKHNPKINVAGTAFAEKEANLGSALPGRVEKEYFAEGGTVKKGDLLVSMSGELLAQTLTEHSTIEKDYQRVARLLEKGSITQQEYDHVKSLFDASSSRLEMVRRNSEITAPFSGTIVEYLVREGENYLFNLNLDPGYSKTSGIVRLMKLDPVIVETEVNEKELISLRTGQKAEVSFDAVPDSVMNGTIRSISPMLSSLTHTAKVKIEVANPNYILKPGMYAKVSICLPEVNSVAIPLSTVYRQPGTADDYVFIVTGRIVARKKITTDWIEGSEAGIRGITAGETVVAAGKDKLVDGSQIEIIN
ncbi:MAG TPA: efflux RND transporter periplasmic adaptor subunit [Bacteroidales bacterium]|nr:efflux RND transporter periplasmic adaptor subunit [Bacteroidales bacterium]